MIIGTDYSVQLKMYTSKEWVGYTKHVCSCGEVQETLKEYCEIAQQLIDVGAITEYLIITNVNVKKEVQIYE